MLLPYVEGAIVELRSGSELSKSEYDGISYLIRSFKKYFHSDTFYPDDQLEELKAHFAKLKQDLTAASKLTKPLIDPNTSIGEIARKLAEFEMKLANKPTLFGNNL